MNRRGFLGAMLAAGVGVPFIRHAMPVRVLEPALPWLRPGAIHRYSGFDFVVSEPTTPDLFTDLVERDMANGLTLARLQMARKMLLRAEMPDTLIALVTPRQFDDLLRSGT